MNPQSATVVLPQPNLSNYPSNSTRPQSSKCGYGVGRGEVESVEEMWRRRSPTSPSSSFARCPSLLNVPTRLTLQRRTIQDRLEKIDSAGEERQKRKRGRARGQGEDGSTDRETPRAGIGKRVMTSTPIHRTHFPTRRSQTAKMATSSRTTCSTSPS